MNAECPIEKLRRLEQEATAKPWCHTIDVTGRNNIRADHATHSGAIVRGWEAANDCEFVVTLRNTLPDLLALYDAAEMVEKHILNERSGGPEETIVEVEGIAIRALLHHVARLSAVGEQPEEVPH